MTNAPHLSIERRDAIAIVRLNRPAKRNALNDPLVEDLGAYFAKPPAGVRAAVLTGAGEHFCAGLDLGELGELDAEAGFHHSRMWARAFEALQFGSLPIVCVLRGAVIGGGLELACTSHVRVAEPTAFYALPESQRGIYTGGGASVRLARLIGTSRMMEMMLTGRVLNAEEGQALALSHYLVGAGEAEARAIALAEKIAGNAPFSNYAIMHALPRIADMAGGDGLFAESLVAAIAQSSPEAKRRMADFLAKRAPKTKA